MKKVIEEESNRRVYISLINRYLLTRMLNLTDESKIMQKVVTDIQDILGFLHFRYSIF